MAFEKTNTKTVTSKETGETFTEVNKTEIRRTKKDEFYMTFVENVSGFYKIKSLPAMKVLAGLCSLAEYDTGRVFLPAERRKALIEKIGIKSSNFSNALTELRKLNLITGDNGIYDISPHIHWKGTNDAREKALKNKGLQFVITYKDFDSI